MCREANTDPGRRHEGLLKVNHHIKLFGWLPFFNIDVDIHQTGPGIVNMYFKTFLGEGVFIQTVTPVEPLLQSVIHRFYSSTWIIHPLAKMILNGEAKQVFKLTTHLVYSVPNYNTCDVVCLGRLP